jgi:hypothetical protein
MFWSHSWVHTIVSHQRSELVGGLGCGFYPFDLHVVGLEEVFLGQQEF